MSELEHNFNNPNRFLMSVDTVCLYKFDDELDQAQLHAHNSWEIAYVTDGAGLFYLEGQYICVSKGDL
ncbi:MAG: AraC family ligand binding domain-containing protein, partial [Vallitaleaceae bacterium]|nr:AraC family ligand binding domain-containing protein [Vallitaleaceae bacterium]